MTLAAHFKLSRRSSFAILAGFGIVLLIGFSLLDWWGPGGRGLAKIKGVDSVNYFGVTHSLLFDHDFNLTNEFIRVPPDSRTWTPIQKGTGLPGSPWGVGYSILEMPFLILGTAMDAVAGNPADGYSRWAIYVYSLGSVVMTGLGLAALFTLLCQVGVYWRIPDERLNLYCLFVTFATFFGTNVGYYTFPHIAHAATFLFASLFLSYWWGIRLSNDPRRWLILGLIGGFLSICRWQDILYLGGPGLFDLLENSPWKAPRQWFRSRILYVAGAAVCWIPQMAEWKIIYGKYLTLPQGDGFLKFPPAYIGQLLFSSRNGWFLWTPLTVIGLVGLIYGAFRATRLLMPWIVVVALEIVVIGCMRTWHGFDSFSSRYLLANSSLIACGLLTLLALSTPTMRRTLTILTACCCLFTSLFAIQFRLDLIPNNETLTFGEVFTDKLHLLGVRKRKMAVREGRALLAEGDAASAVQTLERAETFGEDRQILALLTAAYSATGQKIQADDAAARSKTLLDSRLK